MINRLIKGKYIHKDMINDNDFPIINTSARILESFVSKASTTDLSKL